MSKMETTIKNLLIDSLKPSILSITNESYMHNVPEDSESHFKIVIESNNFKNQPKFVKCRILKEQVLQALLLVCAGAVVDVCWSCC